jgi:hypothetical protein
MKYLKTILLTQLALTGLATALITADVATAKNLRKLPQAESPCGPTSPPIVYCGHKGTPVCAERKPVVASGKTFQCCVKWDCVKCVNEPSPTWRCPHFKCVVWSWGGGSGKPTWSCCTKWKCQWRNPLRLGKSWQ